MKTTAPLSAILLYPVIGTAAGDEKSNDRDPWNGFGIGSWVDRSESVTQGGKTETSREKRTRGEAEKPGGIRLLGRKEGKKPGTFDGEESTSWHIPGYDPALDPKSKLAATSEQDPVIQGKKYACEVKTYEMTRDGEKTTVTFWHCKDATVPYRELPGPPGSIAVRTDVFRVDIDYRGKGLSQKGSVRVVNPAEERKIGEKKVVCVREEGEFVASEGETKGKGKVTTYLSNEVAGREVESVVDGEAGGAPFRRVERIEAFGVVPAK